MATCQPIRGQDAAHQPMAGRHLTSHTDTMTADVEDLMDRDFLSDPDKHRSRFSKLK